MKTLSKKQGENWELGLTLSLEGIGQGCQTPFPYQTSHLLEVELS